MASDRPRAKRRRQEKRDLTFLQVKNKDGRDGLFVDLGKKNQTEMFQHDVFDGGLFIPQYVTFYARTYCIYQVSSWACRLVFMLYACSKINVVY